MFLLLCLPLLGVFHEYHVSISEINWNQNSSKWEVTVHTFIEDLEFAISQQLDTEYVLKHDNPNELISYLERTFIIGSIKSNNMSYVGMEEDGHDVYIHLEFKGESNPGELMIKNTMLTEVFEDQQNMHHITYNQKKYSAYLNRDKTETKIKFDD